MILLRTLSAAVLLASFASEPPAFAQSCSEQFSKCIAIGPTLGFGNGSRSFLPASGFLVRLALAHASMTAD
jgi:hypothetical protein